MEVSYTDKTTCDTEKIALIYELYEKELFRICLSVLRDRYNAEDALHECFLKIIRYRDRICDPASEKCRRFVRKTARNTAINMYRQMAREATYVEGLPEWDTADNSFDMDTLASLTLTEKQVLCSLGQKYRQVVKYICLEGLPVKECAAILKLSEVCVRKRLERAKKQIKENIKNL
ncbi:MAG: sigma-70 family RNA polymerase sigma factor [Clostridia bacterium]|nr:sigma-70 family RNA polymerase sigma factor [Clostridia bacterium]